MPGRTRDGARKKRVRELAKAEKRERKARKVADKRSDKHGKGLETAAVDGSADTPTA
jgi:hypothetical protein